MQVFLFASYYTQKAPDFRHLRNKGSWMGKNLYREQSVLFLSLVSR